jgi:hypothetical protein
MRRRSSLNTFNGDSPAPGVLAPADPFTPRRGALLDFQKFPGQVDVDLADLALVVLPPNLDRVLPLLLGFPRRLEPDVR